MSSLLLSTLGVVCTACDELNAPRSRQCLVCGAALLSRPSEKVAAASQHGEFAKRKPLVVSGRQDNVQASIQGPTQKETSRNPSVSPPAPATDLRKKVSRAGPEIPSASATVFFLTVISGNAKGQRYRIPSAGCAIGRTGGGILFPEDVFVSGRHATLLIRKGQLHVRDDSSASGVFLSIKGQQTIPRGAMFSAGQRLFRFRGPIDAASPSPGPRPYGVPAPPGPEVYAIEEILVGGRPGRVVVGARPVLTVGQMDCDLCFPADEDLAGRHCELTPTAKGAILRDLSGGLGTLARIPAGTVQALSPGDRFRVGQHVLRVEQGS
jgi:hypothetical protein